MGMRLEGPKIENVIDPNIKSEGLVKGVIQITSAGDPIIMLSDHGTIGGYPKIATVISADYDRLVQLTPGSNIKFKDVSLEDAETLYKLYQMETNNIISQIKFKIDTFKADELPDKLKKITPIKPGSRSLSK